jgi:hypothetical protein
MSDAYDDDSPAPRRKKKSSSLPILLIVLGVVGVGCLGACGFVGYFLYSLGMKMIEPPQQLLSKVGGGDFAGAYAMTSPNYKAKHTLEDFTAAMKSAKLDTCTASEIKDTNSVNTTHKVTLKASLQSGQTTDVTFTIQQSGFSDFAIDDITGAQIIYGLGNGDGPPPAPKE